MKYFMTFSFFIASLTLTIANDLANMNVKSENYLFQEKLSISTSLGILNVKGIKDVELGEINWTVSHLVWKTKNTPIFTLGVNYQITPKLSFNNQL